MGGRELITLQLGSFANFTGAHFWNVQDELLGLDHLHTRTSDTTADINHAVLFRAKELQGQVVYTPRALMIDLSGSLGGLSLNQYGSARVNGNAHVSTWGGRVAVHAAQTVPQSDFVSQLSMEAEIPAHTSAERREESGQQAGTSGRSDDEYSKALHASARSLQQPNAVRSWTDYLKANLDSKNVWQLPGLWEGGNEFSGYGSGRNILCSEELRGESQDRIRLLAEECDLLQGFQLLTDDLTGFGSMTAATVALLQEDYSKAPLFAIPTRFYPPAEGEALRLQQLSEALSLAEIAPEVSLYCPVAEPRHLPHAAWPANSRFHASAVCSLAVENMTLPTRLFRDLPGSCDLQALAQMLGRPLSFVCSGAAVPCPDVPDQHAVAQQQDPFTVKDTVSWTPGLSFKGWADGVQSESVVLRGPRRGASEVPMELAAAVLDQALLMEDRRVLRHRCIVRKPMPLPLPFPQIFGSEVQRQGSIGSARRPANQDVEGVSVLSRLGSSAAVEGVISRSLASFKSLSRSGAGKTVLETWGYDSSEIEEVCESLQMQSAAFHDSDND